MLGQYEATKIGTEESWNVGFMSKDEIAFFWPQINEALEAQPELWNSFYTKESLIDGLVKEEFWLMAAAKNDTIHILTLCAVHSFPAGARLTSFWMYGEGLEEAAKLMDAFLENFAQAAGCSWIDGYGRKGYERMLKPYGYSFVRLHVARPVGIGARH